MAEREKYWFKRRRYGLGWIPVTWQGWLSVAFLLVVAVSAAVLILPAKPQHPTTGQLFLFFIVLVMDIATVVMISLAKGPKPHWRWGKKPDDDPRNDF